jgi:hypothetical protein
MKRLARPSFALTPFVFLCLVLLQIRLNLCLQMYFRPAEVDLLWGSPAKAERELGWKRKVDFDSLVKEMVEADVKVRSALTLKSFTHSRASGCQSQRLQLIHSLIFVPTFKAREKQTQVSLDASYPSFV